MLSISKQKKVIGCLHMFPSQTARAMIRDWDEGNLRLVCWHRERFIFSDSKSRGKKLIGHFHAFTHKRLSVQCSQLFTSVYFSVDEVDHGAKKRETKQDIIAISKKYSIVTQFTSFVAIEKRHEDDVVAAHIPSIAELVESHTVDQLPYMAWDKPINTPPSLQPTTCEYRQCGCVLRLG
jgi:hypothetical protein